MRIAWLALLVLMAPVAHAATPTTLHAHVIGEQDMPLNTQEPPADYTAFATFGPSATTLTCLHPTTGAATAGTTSQEFSTSYGYATPTLVEYGMRSADGLPRTHPERGVAADVVLDASTPVVLTWYVGTTVGSDDVVSSPQSAPVPVPRFQLRATIRAGDGISIDNEAYNAGPILLQGWSSVATLVADQVQPADAPGITPMGQKGEVWVYEVKTTLEPAALVLPSLNGFNLRVDFYVQTEACDPDTGMILPGGVGTYSAAGMRPRLDFALADEPFLLLYADHKAIGDDLVLQFGINSVWGPYDLDLDSLMLDVSGPKGVVPTLERTRLVQEYHSHPFAANPVELTYVWPNGNRTAPDGDYTATLSVPNRQGTAVMNATFPFRVDGGKEAAGPAPALLILAMAALAVTGRRRR